MGAYSRLGAYSSKYGIYKGVTYTGGGDLQEVVAMRELTVL